jgi:hypothetical protein
VLQKLIAAPGGDYTVTATGSVQWKETITVKSIKSEDETAEIESYFYEVRVRWRVFGPQRQ